MRPRRRWWPRPGGRRRRARCRSAGVPPDRSGDQSSPRRAPRRRARRRRARQIAPRRGPGARHSDRRTPVALNFVQPPQRRRTRRRRPLVAAVAGTKARIVCTRKTTPLLRGIEKYAVRAGGGANHRFGLDDAALIKDNHIAIAGGVARGDRARAGAVSGISSRSKSRSIRSPQLDEALRDSTEYRVFEATRGPDRVRRSSEKTAATVGESAISDARPNRLPPELESVLEAERKATSPEESLDAFGRVWRRRWSRADRRHLAVGQNGSGRFAARWLASHGRTVAVSAFVAGALVGAGMHVALMRAPRDWVVYVDRPTPAAIEPPRAVPEPPVPAASHVPEESCRGRAEPRPRPLQHRLPRLRSPRTRGALARPRARGPRAKRRRASVRPDGRPRAAVPPSRAW